MIRSQRRIAQWMMALLAMVMLCGAARADEEIAVIVAQDMPDFRLSAAILRDIYLKKIFINEHGQDYIPLNLPAGHVLRRAFSLALFNKNARELQNYWNQRYFHGITPPYVLASPQAVVEFVAKTPGAIGYVPPCDLDSGVKQVLSIPVPPSQQKAVEKLCPSPAAAANSIAPE
ncbi:MAG: hypothetical protein P8164_11020 [Gammaproteobacteria bacterium]|jgi:ABC-type phosphate transport system substrate-binding protein